MSETTATSPPLTRALGTTALTAHPRRRWTRRRLATWAAILLGLGYASVIQSFSWNQTSHYDLIRAMTHDTAVIDMYQTNTGDKAFYHGHWYSARAPGLAVFALPWYGLLSAIDIHGIARAMAAQRGDDETVWAIGLWGNVLPGLLLVLLLARLGERLEPGYGAAAAVSGGLGTLLLPFSTLLFSHVFTAFLCLAAFALLMRERDGPGRLRTLALAGLLVGWGIVAEYPVAFAGIVLALYAASRSLALGRSERLLAGADGGRQSASSLRQLVARDAVVRLAAYGAGVIVALIPLAAYNKWAFGSFTHVAYADIPRQHAGFFGINAPNLRTAGTLLFASRGLLTLSPILIMGAIGTVLMYRRGRRAEALVIGAIALIYLLYDSGYYLPFGGGTPGPRFLITTLPFLALGLPAAFRRYPGPTLALAAASAVAMTLATLTHPLVGYETEPVIWTRLAGQGSFQPTIVSALGFGRGFVAPIPFLVLAGAAVWLALRATPRLRVDLRAVIAGGACLALWAFLAAWAPAALGIDHFALTRTAGAGDRTALHKPWGPHPLTSLAALAFGIGLAALLAAALRRPPDATGGGDARPLRAAAAQTNA